MEFHTVRSGPFETDAHGRVENICMQLLTLGMSNHTRGLFPPRNGNRMYSVTLPWEYLRLGLKEGARSYPTGEQRPR